MLLTETIERPDDAFGKFVFPIWAIYCNFIIHNFWASEIFIFANKFQLINKQSLGVGQSKTLYLDAVLSKLCCRYIWKTFNTSITETIYSL